MKPGDRVRMKHSKEEGFVTKLINATTIEIEIEEGFRLPVHINDLVYISSPEVKLSPESNVQSIHNATLSGVHIAFAPFNDRVYSIYLVNETAYALAYSFYENATGVCMGLMQPEEYRKLSEADILNFDNWPEYHIQILFFSHNPLPLKSPIYKKIKIHSASFYKRKKNIPLLNTNGHLFQLDENAQKIPAEVVNTTSVNDSNNIKKLINEIKPESEIDLHIEKLTTAYKSMSSVEILSLQVNTFKKTLENAIACGLSEITFIHGVGNGVLKNILHKELAVNAHVKFFEEARKDKFGYGATRVVFK
ncbi:MAG: DUF2027 domain-containing protein [Cytophagaceae bacterium]|nr:DUF2027 domain-containing protein [Cytophagaceae bacterium]MDW8456761.1 DUF2027 domain-containing protein [Cytophagaceae bacterium]